MSSMISIMFAILAVAGHAALCVTAFNRLNATGTRWVKSSEKFLLLSLALPSPLLFWQIAFRFEQAPWWLRGYCLVGVVVLTSKIPKWLRQQLGTSPAALIEHRQSSRSEHPAFGGSSTLSKFWSRIPGNQADQLVVEHKTLWVPRLPRDLEGLSITHLSDLHFTGRVAREYFEAVVEEANAMDSQMIAITGDFIDKARCQPWLTEVLGQLQAEHGVYFVLGNHDARVGEATVRAALEEAGMVSLGGRTVDLSIDGRTILLAGDERPWFDGPTLDGDESAALKLLLAHTPDRYGWARENRFDVMLAGHTHGGQVQLPLLGPILSPSFHGTRYASGVFDESPTVMHVSRGVSSKQPWRWLCPPEITQLRLVPEPRPLSTPVAKDARVDACSSIT